MGGASAADGDHGLYAASTISGQHFHSGAGLGADQPLGARPWSDGDPGAARALAQEADDRSQARVAELAADGAGVDHHDVGRAEHDSLVQPGGIVVEESQCP